MRNGILLCIACLGSGQAQADLPSRDRIDRWLQSLSSGNGVDLTQGIDWGVMPGPFYTPELGLGIGAAFVGRYRPDAGDDISQNSTLAVSGYVSSTGAVGLTMQNYAFFAEDRWRLFLDGALSDTPTYYWGEGFSSGDSESTKEKYTAQRVDLRPTIYRRLASSTYFGVGWVLDAQHAA